MNHASSGSRSDRIKCSHVGRVLFLSSEFRPKKLLRTVRRVRPPLPPPSLSPLRANRNHRASGLFSRNQHFIDAWCNRLSDNSRVTRGSAGALIPIRPSFSSSLCFSSYNLLSFRRIFRLLISQSCPYICANTWKNETVVKSVILRISTRCLQILEYFPLVRCYIQSASGTLITREIKFHLDSRRLCSSPFCWILKETISLLIAKAETCLESREDARGTDIVAVYIVKHVIEPTFLHKKRRLARMCTVT